MRLLGTFALLCYLLECTAIEDYHFSAAFRNIYPGVPASKLTKKHVNCAQEVYIRKGTIVIDLRETPSTCLRDLRNADIVKVEIKDPVKVDNVDVYEMKNCMSASTVSFLQDYTTSTLYVVFRCENFIDYDAPIYLSLLTSMVFVFFVLVFVVVLVVNIFVLKFAVRASKRKFHRHVRAEKRAIERLKEIGGAGALKPGTLSPALVEELGVDSVMTMGVPHMAAGGK